MTEEAKTFTQADIDALQAEHTKAIAELNDRHKGELDRKVEQAIKKAQADAEEKARVANMTELEKAQKTAEDYRIKFEAEAEKTALTAQKDLAKIAEREKVKELADEILKNNPDYDPHQEFIKKNKRN